MSFERHPAEYITKRFPAGPVLRIRQMVSCYKNLSYQSDYLPLVLVGPIPFFLSTINFVADRAHSDDNTSHFAGWLCSYLFASNGGTCVAFEMRNSAKYCLPRNRPQGCILITLKLIYSVILLGFVKSTAITFKRLMFCFYFHRLSKTYTRKTINTVSYSLNAWSFYCIERFF